MHKKAIEIKERILGSEVRTSQLSLTSSFVIKIINKLTRLRFLTAWSAL